MKVLSVFRGANRPVPVELSKIVQVNVDGKRSDVTYDSRTHKITVSCARDIAGRFSSKKYENFTEFSEKCGRDLALVDYNKYSNGIRKDERNIILKGVARLITETGANLNDAIHCSKNGYTALHYFAQIGDKETVVFLVETLGLDINAKYDANYNKNLDPELINVFSVAVGSTVNELYSVNKENDKYLGGGNYQDTVDYIQSKVSENGSFLPSSSDEFNANQNCQSGTSQTDPRSFEGRLPGTARAGRAQYYPVVVNYPPEVVPIGIPVHHSEKVVPTGIVLSP